MCRVHRIFISFTVAVWVATLFCVFIVQPEPGPWRMMTHGLLGLAVVLLPYCGYPYLLRGVVQDELRDAAALFLAGWEAAKAPEQDEPLAAPLRSVV